MKSILANWGQIVAGRRSKWVTVVVWVVITAALTLVWPSVNEMEGNSTATLPDDMSSVQATKIAKEQFPNDSGLPLLIVWHREGGLNKDDYAAVQKIYKQLNQDPLKQQKFIPPLNKAPVSALKSSASEDGTALTTPVFFDKNADTNVLQADIEKLQEKVKGVTAKDPFSGEVESSGLNVRFTGPVGIQTDAVALFGQADITLLISTVLLVLILLIVLYRSPLLAIIPLIGVGFAYGVISPILGVTADSGIISFGAQAISIMTVLLFGAGTDYCLFLVSKYRENLLRESDKHQALRLAIKGSGGAVMMSALTVVLGLLTLLLAEYSSYHRFAVPFSLAVLIMGIAALTLVPALFAIFGRASFFPFIPRTREMTKKLEKKKEKPIIQRKAHGRLSQALGRLVTKKPWTVLIGSLIMLGILASFATRIQYTYGLLDSFPKTMPSREGFALISDHFPPGELAPVDVIVDTEGKDLTVKDQLSNLPFVSEVSKPRIGESNKDLQSYQVTLSQNPYTPESIQLIPEIRGTVANVLQEANIGEDHLWIGGETSTLYDTKQVTSRDESIIIPVVIAVIAILLLLYLHSLVAMAYLIATVLLSYFSALGTGWLLLHFGMGASAIQGLIPLYSFVFLVALGEDYNIFLVSSIWRKRKTESLRKAVADGVSETSNVITSAGLILAGTFAVLATLPIQVLVQFGIVTAVGILLDTFIVRPLLVPAITIVLGKYAFWPGKLWKKND